MSMRTVDIQKLIEWLGHDGAIAGLEESDITVSELQDLAAQYGLLVEKKTRRKDIIIDLVNRDTVRVEKTSDELLAMSHDELTGYFRGRRVSKPELLKLLNHLGIQPGREASSHLVEFAAREISDLGMYQRVAKGTRNS